MQYPGHSGDDGYREVFGPMATGDKRIVRDGIRLCRANNCLQASQKLRPHVGQALVLAPKSLVSY